MTLEFSKMNGAGNDFVLIDNRLRRVRLTPEQIVRLCDRQRGVGADGLLMVVPCVSGKADWAWEFHNRDGSTAGMCGNGARCFAAFVRRLTGCEGGLTVETGAGVIRAAFEGERVTISLTEPGALVLDRELTLQDGFAKVHSINTGVPHAVVFVKQVQDIPVERRGAELRRHDAFKPSGTNVNFVEVVGPSRIRVRTFERGVEGETLACGTGVAASALITARVHRFAPPIQVMVQGGDQLEVRFAEHEGQFHDVRLTGPADFVFEGRIQLD